MRCYFSSEKSGPPEEPGSGYVSFVIPELKITFRARCHGTAAACEYASLLALLEFIEINPTVFEGKALELFGDSFTVVNQLNHCLVCRKDLESFRNIALLLREHIPYTIDWIPQAENPAGPSSLSI